MTTNQTYGGAAALEAYVAQLGIGGASHKLTSARVATLVSGAAAQVNGVLLEAGISPADVATAAAGSVPYDLAQRLVCLLVLPDVVTSLFDAEQIEQALEARAQALELLEKIRQNPALLGMEQGTTAPVVGVGTTVQTLGLDTSDEGRRRRWKYRLDDSHSRKNRERW